MIIPNVGEFDKVSGARVRRFDNLQITIVDYWYTLCTHHAMISRVAQKYSHTQEFCPCIGHLSLDFCAAL